MKVGQLLTKLRWKDCVAVLWLADGVVAYKLSIRFFLPFNCTKSLSISMLYIYSDTSVYGCNTVTHQQLDRNTSKSVTDVNSKPQQCIDRNVRGATGSRLVSGVWIITYASSDNIRTQPKWTHNWLTPNRYFRSQVVCKRFLTTLLSQKNKFPYNNIVKSTLDGLAKCHFVSDTIGLTVLQVCILRT